MARQVPIDQTFERHLHDNQTIVVKVYLHVSKEEQRKRLLARIDEPAKNWKISLADIEERKYWKAYVRPWKSVEAAGEPTPIPTSAVGREWQ